MLFQVSLLMSMTASLLINEVLYDPPGRDSQREFIELINSSTAPIALTGVVLEWADGARDRGWQTLWESASGSIAPGALFVVGGDSIATRDAVLAKNIQNGPDALRLRKGTQILDVLGYGALTNANLFEGRPAPDVRNLSLGRQPDGRDTDNNAEDFHSAAPSPGRRNTTRHDIAVQLGEPDWSRLWPGRIQRLPVVIRNQGTQSIPPDSLQLQAWLVAEASTERIPLQRAELTFTLASHDSFVGELTWLGSLGAFTAHVQLVTTDEILKNNADSLLIRFGPGKAMINEFVYAPTVGNPEWLEIKNLDGTQLSLAGWTIEDATAKRSKILLADELAPGELAIISADVSETITHLEPGTRRAKLQPWPSLNNTDGPLGFADRLILRDSLGEVVDAFFYSSAWGGKTGRSLERLTVAPDVRGLLWSVSKDPLGSTPGRPNSSRASPQTTMALRLSPNPFSPNGDGVDESLQIQLMVPKFYSGYKIQIFDLQGRRIKRLAGDRLGPGPRTLSWEGVGQGTTVLATNVYLFQFEFFGLGVPPLRELRTVGLVGR